MHSRSLEARQGTLTLAGVVALASMVVVLAVSGAGAGYAATHRAAVPMRTASAVAFRDRMRALWETHGAWTHYAADAQAYAPYIRHILDMADMISGGIIKQFPRRFR
jgi:hypothetical protein